MTEKARRVVIFEDREELAQSKQRLLEGRGYEEPALAHTISAAEALIEQLT